MKKKTQINCNCEGVRLLLLDSLTKVFCGEEPLTPKEEPLMEALRGECISFQLAWSFDGLPEAGGRRRPFCFTGLRIESPVKEYLRVRSVCSVPSQYPAHPERDDNYLRCSPGLYPDLLTEPDNGIVVFRAGQWSSLWVDFDVPADAVPGTYPVRFLFETPDGGKVLCSLQTELTVLLPVLPAQTLLRTEWLHADCLADYYHVRVFSEEHWRILENFIRTAARRGVNMILTPQFTPPLDTAVGRERTTVQLVQIEKRGEEYRFDFSLLRRWVKLCRKCGIRYFEMSHLFSQWGAVAAPKIVGKENGEEKILFGWHTPASGGAYAGFLHAYLPQLRRVLAELGIAEQTYFHISDEPKLSQLQSYRAAYEIVKDDLAGCRFLEALSDYEFYRTGLVSRPVCASSNIQPFLERHTPGLWTYYCTAQSVDVSNCFFSMPLGRTRMIGVQLYLFQIEGLLHWGYNFYNSAESWCHIDPYRVTDAGGAFPSGDPFLVYPGRGGVPEESIRLMALYEAMTDLRALQLLESLAGREFVLALIGEGLPRPITFSDFPKWPQDAVYLTGLRRKVNRAVCEAMARRESVN